MALALHDVHLSSKVNIIMSLRVANPMVVSETRIIQKFIRNE